jgi:hypothetical protein
MWDRYIFHIKRVEIRYGKLEFFHPVVSVVHIVHFGTSGMPHIDTLFFILGWDRYRFHRKCAGTRCVELVFLHPVGPRGHVVHSGASGV